MAERFDPSRFMPDIDMTPPGEYAEVTTPREDTMTIEIQHCPACDKELCRIDSRAPFDVSIGIMEDAMEAHLPNCGPSNTPEVKTAALTRCTSPWASQSAPATG